jgi:hypothetical protein
VSYEINVYNPPVTTLFDVNKYLIVFGSDVRVKTIFFDNIIVARHPEAYIIYRLRLICGSGRRATVQLKSWSPPRGT